MKNQLTWYKLAIFNLALVALLGVMLRYNQLYYIPFIEQRNLQHAHSHFAFAGWIGFLLNVLVIDKLLKGFDTHPKKWNNYLLISTIVNYGMMISFMLQGYKSVSIIFSTASLFVGYYFAYTVWKELNTITAQRKAAALPFFDIRFTKASLFFLIISSLGPYALAWLTLSNNAHAYMNHNALYWFLHFQYNGFFSFAVLGLFMYNLQQQQINTRHLTQFFYLLVIVCIPAYLLTFLWRGVIPAVLISNIITALLLVAAISLFILFIRNNLRQIKQSYSAVSLILIAISISAYIIKVSLQSITAFPALSHLVFGYRSIVVGYLHLIFLVFISLFLISELIKQQVLTTAKPAKRYIILGFAFFVLMNELLLGLQGLSAVTGIEMPNLYPALFYNSCFMFITAAGMATLTINPLYNQQKNSHANY